MPIQRQWNVMIYGQDGTTLKKNVPPSALKSNPTFKSRINGGLGECVLDLSGPSFTFDNFGEGTTVAFMNIVDIWAVSTSYPLGKRIYRGYISRYQPYINDTGEEGVKVTCLGLVSLFTKSYFTTGARGPEDPTVTAKAIVDHFNTVYGGNMISYDSSSIPATVGTNISYTFTDQRWYDALTQAGKLSGTGWWWSVDADGKLQFKAKPSSATWSFTIGKDITSIEATKTSEQAVNDLQVRRSDGTTTTYSDAPSQASFGTGNPATGKCSEIITDSSIPDLTTADQRGIKEIADNKDAKVSAVITLNTFADIEAIHVGDTCLIMNFNMSATTFNQNMQIIALTYNGDSLQIELEQAQLDFGLSLQGYLVGG